jgi:signal recognition particle GTPase
VVSVVGVPIAFVGSGETLADLERSTDAWCRACWG